MECNRTGYNPDQIIRTVTVGELIEILEQFDPEAEVFTSHDNGYTYGGIGWDDFTEGAYDDDRIYIDGEENEDW